ncbi:hypothetical protein [Metapseudomonas resinovorans]|uniref:hypothetical protein n=1 Tax=Metapseudomonas resinovorans TaxID=53412 RepID=UPI00131D5C76|nr:hypothetical protein [Pseudomonas resinovorans]
MGNSALAFALLSLVDNSEIKRGIQNIGSSPFGEEIFTLIFYFSAMFIALVYHFYFSLHSPNKVRPHYICAAVTLVYGLVMGVVAVYAAIITILGFEFWPELVLLPICVLPNILIPVMAGKIYSISFFMSFLAWWGALSLVGVVVKNLVR